MRVLIVQLWPRFETALELAQVHLDAGDDVVFMGCNAELTACWNNYDHLRSVCSKCMKVRELGLSLLEPRLVSRSLLRLTEANRRELAQLQTSFADLEALKQYTVDDFDVGMAVASGIMTDLRDPAFDVVELADAIKRFLVSTMAVYRSVQNHLEAERYDRVYVANGRGVEVRAVLRACLSRQVPCLVHEGGKDPWHYDLYENCIPHEIAYNEKCIRKAWAGAEGKPDRESIASKWYEDRAAGVDRDWVSLVKHQENGRLPDGFDPTRHNVVVFNSSEDEFAALGDEWRNPIYKDQTEGLQAICRSAAHMSGAVQVYLRVHPFLKGVNNATTRALAELGGPHFRVIPATDPISTYALMRVCATVVAFGSTTGIEAVYWGKPSISAGMCFYRNLGGTYNPASHEELMQLMQCSLQPRDRVAALMYGYYLATHGIAYQYYRRDSYAKTHFVVDGTFKSRRLEVPRLTHYLWAAVHRWPWLNRLINARHAQHARRSLDMVSSSTGNGAACGMGCEEDSMACTGRP
jgi:hypothetical protein